VIQEWWGLNDQIRGVADKLAKAGTARSCPISIAGDSGRRQGSEPPDDGTNFGDAAAGYPRAVHTQEERPREGRRHRFLHGRRAHRAVGVNVPEMDAGVIWYGYPPLEYVDASKIKAPATRPLAMHDPGLRDRRRRQAGGEAARSEGELRVPPLRREARLCERDRDSKGLEMLKYDPKLPRRRGSARWISCSAAPMKDDVKVRVYDVLAKAFMLEGVRTVSPPRRREHELGGALAEQGCHMIYVRHEHGPRARHGLRAQDR